MSSLTEKTNYRPEIDGLRAFYDHMHDYVAECYEEDEVKPPTLAPALADMRACQSPDESAAISFAVAASCLSVSFSRCFIEAFSLDYTNRAFSLIILLF